MTFVIFMRYFLSRVLHHRNDICHFYDVKLLVRGKRDIDFGR
jgi:hypothetical protein